MNDEQVSPPVLTDIPRYSPEASRATSMELPASGIPGLNLALFALTLLTTTMAGAYSANIEHPLQSLANLARGLPFSLTLMAILGAHEMGHFIVARRNKVNVSWPYFFPAPMPYYFFTGTFGAFIRMKSPPRSRRVMFDIGAAGPWAGALLAVPAVIVGLKLSDVAPLDTSNGGLDLGNSMLFWGLSRWILGVDPNSVSVTLHPIALAGWIGLFVTTLNLLPVGQLDGGHVIYALFGRRHRIISRVFVFSCVLMVVVPYLKGWSFWLGWLMWAVLLLFLGLGHPSTMDVDTPLDRPRRIAAWMTIVLFVVTFSPVPLSIIPPKDVPRPNSNTYEVRAPLPRDHATMRAVVESDAQTTKAIKTL